MSDVTKDPTDVAEREAGDRLDSGLAALIPRDRWGGRALDVLKLAGGLPVVGECVKLAAVVGGWWLEDRKPDRVFPVLLALKDKIHEAESKRNEYIRKDEFRDIFEETLRLIAEEPDPDRRKWLQNILLKIIDVPRDHTAHRRFLRLVEELTMEAHKILAVLDKPFTSAERQLDRDDMLAARSGLQRLQIPEALDELAREGLVILERFKGPAPSEPVTPVSLATPGGLQFEASATHGRDSFSYVLTRLGGDLISYRRA